MSTALSPLSISNSYPIHSLHSSIRDSTPSDQLSFSRDHDDGDTFFELLSIHLDQPVGSMSISPAYRDVALGARKGLFIVDLQNPYDPPRFLPHNSSWEVADVQWNPFPCRSEWVVSTSNQKAVVYNLSLSPSLSISPIEHTLHAHTRAVTDINWSPASSEILATSGLDGRIWSWDLRTGYGTKSGKGGGRRPVWGVCSWGSGATQVKWNRREPHIIASSHDNHVLIWDDRMGAAPVTTIRGHNAKIYGIDWSRESPTEIVTCSLDKTFKAWSILDTTSPSLTVLTSSPVWRARYLPFGSGILTLPQRSDHALSIWGRHQIEASKPEEVAQPVARFLGATAGVKEFVWRTRGGDDLERDDREFQLVTWARDRRLRLWPISEEILKGTGHVRGGPIRIPVTRRGCPNISYRSFADNPPLQIPLAFPQQQTTSPTQTTSLVSPVLAGPSLLTSSLLSAGFVSGPPASVHSVPLPPLAGLMTMNQPTPNVTTPAVRRGAATMTTTSVRNKRQKAHDRLAWMEGVQRLLPVANSDGIIGGGGGGVAGVGGGGEERPTRSSSLVRGTDGGITAREGGETERESIDEGSRTTAVIGGRGKDANHANLGEEITSVVRRFQRINFEKMNISGRTCTVSLYTPLFIRATFFFPKNYPHSSPPTIEIEKTADIPGRTRAFLLQNVRRIMLARCILGLPSLEAALRFLLGDREENKESDGDDDEDEDESVDLIGAEHIRRNLNTPPPRRGGAVFGPRGQILVFFPTNVVNVIPGAEKGVNAAAVSRGLKQPKRKRPPRLSESFGFLPNLDGGVDDVGVAGYQEADETLQMPRGPSFRSLATKSKSTAAASTILVPGFSSLVHIKNVSHLVLLRPSAIAPVLSTSSSPLMVANQILEDAIMEKDVFNTRIWTTLVGFFGGAGGRSAETILAERVLAELLRYLIHLREVQTAGLIACLLELHRRSYLRQTTVTITTHPRLPTPIDYFSHHRASSSPILSSASSDLLTPMATKHSSSHSPRPSWTNLAGLFNASVLSLRSAANSPTSITSPSSPTHGGLDTPTQSHPNTPGSSLRHGGSPEDFRSGARPALSRQSSILRAGRVRNTTNVSFGGTRVDVIHEGEGSNEKKKGVAGKRIVVKFVDNVGFGDRPPWWLSPVAQVELELLRLGFASLLDRWEQDQARLGVLKLCSREPGFASSLVRTSNGIGDRTSLRLERKCPACGGALLVGETACPTCRRRPKAAKCVLCHLPVSQLAQSCSICLHVGHLTCLKSWFEANDGCPTGCGCSCITSGGAGGIFILPPSSTPLLASPVLSIPSPTISRDKPRYRASLPSFA